MTSVAVLQSGWTSKISTWKMRDEAKVWVDSLNSAQLHSFFLCAFNNQHASNGGILVENNFTSNCFISREPLFYPFRKDLPNPKQLGFPKKWPLKPGKDRLPTSHPFFWVPGSSRSFASRSCWKRWSSGPIAMCRSFDNYKPGRERNLKRGNVGCFFVRGGFLLCFGKRWKCWGEQ